MLPALASHGIINNGKHYVLEPALALELFHFKHLDETLCHIFGRVAKGAASQSAEHDLGVSFEHSESEGTADLGLCGLAVPFVRKAAVLVDFGMAKGRNGDY